MKIIQYISFLLLAVALFAGCKNAETRRSRHPSARAEEYKHYLFGYPSGVMRKGDRWILSFAKPVFDTAQIGKSLRVKGINFSPALSGAWKCLGPTTLEFLPEKSAIRIQQPYIYTIDLKEFFPAIEPRLRYAQESFEYAPSSLAIEWGVLRHNYGKPGHLILLGNAKTADLSADLAIIQKHSWVEDGAGKKYPLQNLIWDSVSGEIKITIDFIQRLKKAQQWTVSLPAVLDNPQLRTSHSFYVPAVDEFAVLGCDVNSLHEGKIGIFFSDPVADTINFRNWLELLPAQSAFTLDHKNDELWINFDAHRYPEQGEIRLRPGIPSSNGSALTNAFQYAFSIKEPKPQVRFLSEGTVLPYDDHVVLPFEAINLHTVVLEIFKIFSNNALHSLHLSLSEYDSYYLTKLGRVVYQEKIDLKHSDNRRDWKRYSLDLSKIIKAEPGAFYEIRLVFRPEHSDYLCDKKLTFNFDHVIAESGTDEFVSVWNQWAPSYDAEPGDNSEYNYDWQDPCSPAYYSSEHYARLTVLASNLAVSMKYAKGEEAAYVTVTNIQTALPVGGAKLEWYDRQLQCIGKSSTSSDGLCKFSLDREPAILVAHKDKNFAYLKMDEAFSRPVSEFDAGGVQFKQGLKAALYSERAVYRPGDTIFFQTVLHQVGTQLPPSLPVRLKVFNPKRQLVFEQVSSNHIMGLYSFVIPTQPQDLTGTYKLIVNCGASEFSKTVWLETIKPNRFKVAHELQQDLKLYAEQNWHKSIQVNWMHGAVAANKELDIAVKYAIVQPSFKKFKDYNFIDPELEIKGEFALFKGKSDAKGQATFSIEPLAHLPITGMAKASWISKIMDDGGEISTDYLIQNIWPSPAYVGVKFNANHSRYHVDASNGEHLELIALDEKENALAGRKIGVELFEVFSEWWYEIRNRNFAGFHYDNYRRKIGDFAVTTNAHGKALLSLNLQQYKQYLVKVTDVKSGYRAGEYFSTGWYYGDNKASKTFASLLSLKSDKENYTVGEKIRLSLPRSANGYFHIAVIRGSRILQQARIKANESTPFFELEATADMCPNAYVDVSLIQPRSGIGSDLPLRLYGIIPVSVERPENRLIPVLKVSQEVKPQQEFELEVSEQYNREMAYHVFIVDEGILSLTRFVTPDPYKEIFAKEALTMMTWDNYSEIIGRLDAATERVISIGGDGVGLDAAEYKNQRFKPLVLRSGPQFLRKAEKRKHRFRINNFVGEVRVMVVANNWQAYGAVEKSVKVKQDLFCQLTLPRAINIGDEISLPVNVFTASDMIRQVKVQLTAEGPIRIVDAAQKAISFDKAGEKMVSFKVRAKDVVGNASVDVRVEGHGLGHSERIEFFIDNPNPITHQTKELYVESGKSITGQLPVYGTKGTRSAVLAISTLPDINLTRLCEELIQYPHGCLEQIVSSAFPQLFLPAFADLHESQDALIRTHIQQSIVKLQRLQRSDGSLAYWPGTPVNCEWANTYAFHFLVEAMNRGFMVPDVLFSNLYKHLRRSTLEYKARQSSELHWPNSNQAYRLYVLSLAGKPEWSMMNRLYSFTHIDLMSRWLLAGAYALAGKSDLSEKLATGQGTEIASYNEMSHTFGSEIRDEALISIILSNMKKMDQAYKTLLHAVKKFKGRQFYSTQEAAFILIAIYHSYTENAKLNHTLTAEYSWNGKKHSVQSNKSFISVPVDGDVASNYSVHNKSSGPLFVAITQFGKNDRYLSTPSSQAIQIEVKYSGSSMDKPNTFKQGDRITMTCVLKNVKNITDYSNIAWTIPVPAGFEIVNRRMGQAVLGGDHAYHDIRDDRVVTYTDLPRGATKTFQLELIAAYTGQFMQPEIFAAAMYDPSVFAKTQSGKMEIVSN